MPDDTLERTLNCAVCGEEFSTEDPEQDVCDECFEAYAEDEACVHCGHPKHMGLCGVESLPVERGA